jgi:hypothetical protein
MPTTLITRLFDDAISTVEVIIASYETGTNVSCEYVIFCKEVVVLSQHSSGNLSEESQLRGRDSKQVLPNTSLDRYVYSKLSRNSVDIIGILVQDMRPRLKIFNAVTYKQLVQYVSNQTASGFSH